MLTKAFQYLFITLIVLNVSVVANGEQSISQNSVGDRHDYPEVPRISGYEAKKIFEQGKLLLVNAHTPETFRRGHIIGSINIPGDAVRSMNVNLPKDIIVAFYCA